jgi:hypothetical protein
MAPDQLQLDFSVTETRSEKASIQSASVHNLDEARRVRQKDDLGTLYQGIYESVKHVRLNRATFNSFGTPTIKR